MPSTREVRNRIKSLKGTQQITRAMKMVAAAKVRRAQERVAATRPYAEKILQVFQQAAERLRQEDIQEPLLEKREIKNVGLLLLTADRGMCGSYNSNMFRYALQKVEEIEAAGQTPKVWLVGNKAVGFFRHAPFEVLGRYTQLTPIPTFAEADLIGDAIVEAFLERKVDRVLILYTHFVSMLQYTPSELQLFPVEPPPMAQVAPLRASYLYEPDAQSILREVLPRYIDNEVYHSLLEAAASELAARMTAMDAATKNAEDMLAELTLLYNKVRQSYITTEILEVVGGAEAQKQ